MPLREDLLEPIAGENPSGPNLYYDKIFDQIREARIEDVDFGSSGAWERSPKKADHALVIKLAGETLAKRTKDIRLAGWLIESHIKREGISIVAPSLELLWRLQETFWETLHPEIEEDGDVALRIGSIEGTVSRVAALVQCAPITRTGLSALQYNESRRVGFEADANTSEKEAARQDAIDHGKITGEDFDASFASTPKLFYVAAEESLIEALAVLEGLDGFQVDRYGDDYPGLGRLIDAIREVKQTVTALLQEKRKTEPDAVEPAAIVEQEDEPPIASPEEARNEQPAIDAFVEPGNDSRPRVSGAVGLPSVPATAQQAAAAILGAAEFLRTENPSSPAAYLVCAGFRLGETRREGASPAFDFAVAPPTETRQALRKLANEGSWDDLMKLCLRTLTEPCGRAWLDLQRYSWRAARELGFEATAKAVTGTVRGLLYDLPELRRWMLDDDTPVANTETQAWIDAEVLPPVAEAPPCLVDDAPSFAPAIAAAPQQDAEEPAPIYDQALALLQQGRAGDGLALLARDAEAQTSGRKRFERRIEIAQLCLAAGREAVAYPLLVELAGEMERRNLETWESGAMLAHPLSLLLQCLDRRNGATEEREALFERLCRLSPEAALTAQRS